MRKVVLFIAMSLDGYIADENGKVDWLVGENPEAENLDTYSEFVKNVDTVIMGWNTYHQVVSELSPDEWIYKDLQSYVITHRELHNTENVIFSNESPCDIVKKLKQQKEKDIWICGGSTIIHQLVKENLIDVYYITVIPTLLGKGIRLFESGSQEIKLQLIKTQSYNGMTDLVYKRR